MNAFVKCIVLGLVLLIGAAASAQLQYPATKTVDAADTYFGHTYKDPYRWLENLQDPEVEDWFKTQATLTDRLLARIPGRDELVEEWTALDKLKAAFYFGLTSKEGRLFYRKSMGGGDVSKLYFRDGWNGEEKLLFDPTRYELQSPPLASRQGMTSLYSFTPSWDGKHVAIAVTRGGAEYSEIRVLNVDDGRRLPECIYPSFGCYGWTADGKAFFYDAKAVSDVTKSDIKLNGRTKLHTLSSDTGSDWDVFSNERYPQLGIASNESPRACVWEACPEYIVGGVVTSQEELRFYYAPVSGLKDRKLNWNVLCKRSDNLVQGPAFHGNYIYAVTIAGAPGGRVVRTSLSNPDWEHAQTVIPKRSGTIRSISMSKDYLLVVYTQGVTNDLVKYNLKADLSTEVKLPGTGTVDVTCPDWKTDHYLVSVSSWTSVTLYDFDPRNDGFAKSVFNPDLRYPGFEDLVSEEVEVPGHEGAMIPLSIFYKRGLPLTGTNSCLLEGYGAYGTSVFPRFSVFNSIATHGVVRAFAHVRGGGEKGEDWYKAGYKTTKPNSWKDFISCAEYLVKKGYTNPHELAAIGGSAGGITVGRAITERPDLFAAAVCDCPVVNAMRAEFTPNGPGNIPEFGSVHDPVECRALFEMDVVQHIRKDVRYPAVMGSAGWNDQRVPVWEAGKLVAALQAVSGKPALLKVNYDSGHGTEEKLAGFKNVAGQFAFLLWQTGQKDFQPVK